MAGGAGIGRREKAAGGPMLRVGVPRYSPAGEGLPGGNSTGMWRFVEFGTSQAPAQSFMRPAMAGNASKITAAIVADP